MGNFGAGRNGTVKRWQWLAIAAAAAWLEPATARAQAPAATPAAAGGNSAGVSRQERMRQHQLRVEKILEDNRKKDEERKRLAAGGAPAAAPGATPAAGPGAAGGAPPGTAPPPQPGAVLATGATSIAPVPPGGAPAGGAAPDGNAPQPNSFIGNITGAQNEARAVVFFNPADNVVRVGETFVTEVIADTKSNRVDAVELTIAFPEKALNPLAINLGSLKTLAAGDAELKYNEGEPRLSIRVPLKEPMVLTGQELISVTWEAIGQTEGAQLRFNFDKNANTALRMEGTDLLGSVANATDGVVHGTVRVKAASNASAATAQKVGARGLLMGLDPERASSADRAGVRFAFGNIPDEMRVGQMVDVPIVLQNPALLPIDRLYFSLQVDPAQWELVDHDSGNLVRIGTNFHDARARERFPFTWSRRNDGDPATGLLVYDVGADSQPIEAAGELGRVRLRALRADAEPSTIRFVTGSPTSTVPGTGIEYLSRSINPAALRAEALPAAAIAVLPATNGARMVAATAAAAGFSGDRTGRAVLRKGRQFEPEADAASAASRRIGTLGAGNLAKSGGRGKVLDSGLSSR